MMQHFNNFTKSRGTSRTQGEETNQQQHHEGSHNAMVQQQQFQYEQMNSADLANANNFAQQQQWNQKQAMQQQWNASAQGQQWQIQQKDSMASTTAQNTGADSASNYTASSRAPSHNTTAGLQVNRSQRTRPLHHKDTNVAQEGSGNGSSSVDDVVYTTINNPNQDDYHSFISQKLHIDPAPMLAPKSKKMALGSITFTSENAREFGVYIKDNSFMLRCEKCDPMFNERLNNHVHRSNGVTHLPISGPAADRVHDKWPAMALNNYCNDRDPAGSGSRWNGSSLQRDMNKVYRRWHDGRCGMHELYQRVAALLR